MLTFLFAFGVVKAITNLVAGTWADRVGRKRVLIVGWLVGVPVPLLLMWAPSSRQPIVEVVHETRLAAGGQRALADAREGEHLAHGRTPFVVAGLVRRVRERLAHEERGRAETEADEREPEEERRGAEPPSARSCR